ncbi:MAG: glycosyltransferase family 4 protein [Planctomycetes bacterium]|nr:glycosyltransferase family 4 protein [Planctomycetota bacterium]MBL7037655.1 glycosyltransferase family 4 protein [Pirellulaceae bacterium]
MPELISPLLDNTNSPARGGAAEDRPSRAETLVESSPSADSRRLHDKINVLFLMDEFATPCAGSEQHLLYLLRRLPRESLRVHFAVLGDVSDEHSRLFPDEPIVLGRGYRFSPANAVKRLVRLARVIRSLHIDVVHAFFQSSETAALLATRLARQGKVLGVRRDEGFWHTRRTLWQARVMRLLRAEYAANCGAAKESAVHNEWLPTDRITIIPNPLSTERLAQGLCNVALPESLGIRNGEQVVGIVATLRPVKDHPTFLHAARSVLRRFPHARFLVVGRQLPEYFDGLRSLAGELEIDKQISWVGSVENPVTVLPHCDVGVLSSSSEGLSNALIEYASVGVPTVATDVGGNSEVVEEGRTGFLVPAGSPEPMADRICKLLSDSALRETFGENARRHAELRFSEKKVLEEYVNLYMRLTGKPVVTA